MVPCDNSHRQNLLSVRKG